MAGGPVRPTLNRNAVVTLRLGPGLQGLERVTRLELATSSLARRCSTTELHPLMAYQPNPKSEAGRVGIMSGTPAEARLLWSEQLVVIF